MENIAKVILDLVCFTPTRLYIPFLLVTVMFYSIEYNIDICKCHRANSKLYYQVTLCP